MKILVWLSGWVDSAVAAYLLKEQGHEVVAGFMKNYIDPENPNCTTYQDANEAVKVANFLWIEIISFDLRKEYEEKIVKYIYDWYEKWITPNPDILCNSLIKFDVFLDKALAEWYDMIAMGHYARIESTNTPLTNETKKSYKLLRWKDYNKDQSYFLSWLNQYQLSKSLFPIGELGKDEVRKIAKEVWLPNAERPDSQGLCFIGKVPMRVFLKKRLPIKKWNIVLMDGTKVWEHDGAYFFTIGQSRGLDINKKAYVVKLDVKNNLVVVSYEKQEAELLKDTITTQDWHWIGEEYTTPLDCTTKIRYRQEPNQAKIEKNENWMKVTFPERQWWVAPGQTVVAYLWDECIGGGIIE